MSSMFLNIPLILITTVGIIFNGYIVTAILLTRQVTSANSILLLHLGTIDLLLGILFLVFCAPGFTRNGWLNDGPSCLIHGFLYTLLHPMALWTICGLNCDRFYAIAAPLHYTHIVNPKKVLFGLACGWLISLLLCIPPFFAVAPYTYIKGMGICAPDFSYGSGSLWYSTLYTAFTLLLPATIIICCNLKILMIARYHRHRIASAIYEVTLSAQVTITHQRNPFFVPTVTAPSSGGPKFRGRSAIYAVFQLVGSLTILYLPYYSLILWQATIGSIQQQKPKIHPHFYTITMCLLVCTTPINGFFYGLKSKPLRKAFKNYWRKKQTKSEVNQEIQARTPSTCGSRRPSLTPLGFLTKPTLQRRLSEALLDRAGCFTQQQQQKHRIKQGAGELNWRPSSANSLNLLPTAQLEETRVIKQVASCNTLQVPSSDNNEITATVIIEDNIKTNCNTNNKKVLKTNRANFIFQRIFGGNNGGYNNDTTVQSATKKSEVVQNILEIGGTPRKYSPRITITRTYSEDSDTNNRKEVLNRKMSSSSATLFEKRWRHLKDGDNYQVSDDDDDNDHDDDDDDDEKDGATRIPLLLDNSSHNGSDSSSSEHFNGQSRDGGSAGISRGGGGGGGIFMALDCKVTNTKTDGVSEETQELLLWNNNNNSSSTNCSSGGSGSSQRTKGQNVQSHNTTLS